MKLMEFLEKIRIVRTDGIYYIGGSDVLPPPLKGKEELDVLEALERGSEQAKQQLIERNL